MILVINAGSSSLKYKLFDHKSLKVIRSKNIQNIDKKFTHQDAIDQLLSSLDVSKVKLVAHRVVHGASLYSKATLIDDEVIENIKNLNHLAPLHNPINLKAIEFFKKSLPQIKHIAVFDTAFHQTMKKSSYLYAIPKNFYENYHIRRYGFHGTSHKYLVYKSAQILNKPLDKVNLITLHLGAGASVCAIENGISVDTSMGFTPLEGLIMGTRSGTIDAAILPYLINNYDFSVDELDTILNKKSGLKAICDESNMQKILSRDDEDALLAIEMFVRSIKKTIGSYMAILDSVDAIVFSGGIGENSQIIKEKVLNSLEKNLHLPKVLTIKTDEEWQMAYEALSLMED